MERESQRLVEEHESFARRLARKFYSRKIRSGLERSDFESAALYGLCDAATRYDGSAEAQFRTFAHQRIRGAMLDLARKAGGVPRGQVKKDKESAPTVYFRQGLAGSMRELMFEAGVLLHISDDHRVIGISYSSQQSPESLAAQRLLTEWIRDLVSELPEKERLVVELRYFQDLTFEEMRDHFDGATRSWLSRIHAKALLRLRQRLEEQESDVERRVA